MRNRPRLVVVATSFALIAIACSESTPPGADSAPAQVQAVSFLGDTLVAGPSSAAVEVQSPLLAAAREALEANPDDPEAWIWVGRRLGYLQEYRDAIDVYSQAIQRFPDDPRLYRHRGHRYISVRELDGAIQDFERAAELIEGTEDQVEPDGLPNARGIPTSTLHFNIWYHLGLAHYLAGDYEAAIEAYHNGLAVSDNPDALVATSYWTYLTLQRLGRAEAAAGLLGPISAEMDIIENDAYRNLLLLYKGELEATDVVPDGEDALASATAWYGVVQHHRFEGREDQAEAAMERLLAMSDQWASFGFIAAEADAARP
ncbi:MAG: tetratricopeptide repeat protein [Gemmatimonadetes bacterium]|nr:tetratricopeptide repeat protein [Gemmatimonadota bacterium]